MLSCHDEHKQNLKLKLRESGMTIGKTLCICLFVMFEIRNLCATPLSEQFRQIGYVEICNQSHTATTFDSFYVCFDEFIAFLQKNPVWEKKLFIAKERFIRSNGRNYYSTDFFGFYDESKIKGRNQISFYYSVHFHEFILTQFIEFSKIPEIFNFFQACFEIQKPYGSLFKDAALDLGIGEIFFSNYNQPPILLKVVKYLPSYRASRPHYDGTAFTLLLDSTDNQSLFLSSYKSSYSIEDFSSPLRKFVRSSEQNSILLMPGVLLSEFLINPTPHIVMQSGKNRYATIAFAMRPHHIPLKKEFSALPNF